LMDSSWGLIAFVLAALCLIVLALLWYLQP
jgi:hypothetical protein